MMRGPAFLKHVLTSGQCALIYGEAMSLDLMLDRMCRVARFELRPLDLRVVSPEQNVDVLRDLLKGHLKANRRGDDQKPVPVIVGASVDDRVRAVIFEAVNGQLDQSGPRRLSEPRPVPPLVMLQTRSQPSADMARMVALKVPATRFAPLPKARKKQGAKRGH